MPQGKAKNQIQPKTLRRLVTLLLILAAGLLQSTSLMPRLFGIPLLPLLPLTVAAAMFERETFGLCFGIVAGALTDIGATAADGVNTLFFAAAGFICGLLVTYVFLNNVRSCLILGAVVMLLYAPFSWLAHVGFSAAGESVPLLFGFYLPIAVLGIAMLPPLYYLLRHIAKGFCTDGDDDYIFV